MNVKQFIKNDLLIFFKIQSSKKDCHQKMKTTKKLNDGKIKLTKGELSSAVLDAKQLYLTEKNKKNILSQAQSLKIISEFVSTLDKMF